MGALRSHIIYMSPVVYLDHIVHGDGACPGVEGTVVPFYLGQGGPEGQGHEEEEAAQHLATSASIGGTKVTPPPR